MSLIEHPTSVADLIERVKNGTGADNATDVLVEIALFEPDAYWVVIRANSAGTKIVYTDADGGEEAFWARDWTTDREATVELLKARAEETANAN